MNKILIYTGRVKSGKTTRLMEWAASKKNVCGIFQPVIDEKRFVYHIDSRSLKALECSEEANSIIIGNYKFDLSTLEWARNSLLDSFYKNSDWLIIDEVGPLELEGQGLEPVISKIISECGNFKGRIIFIVREKILNRFLDHYKISSYEEFDTAQH